MDLEAYLDGFDRRDWQTTTEGTVRFALVGLGWWTTDHALPAIESSDLCETTTLVSSSTEKAERIAEDWDTVAHAITYDEFHDGAAADAYDAVYICTPNALHLPYVETAAALGKGILCEKPMESTVERAEALVEAAESRDATLMIAYRMHTEPVIRRARELVRDGVIGDPVLVHSNNSQPLLDMIPDPDQWRLNAELSGYGTSVMDLGVYSINTARFVLDADPVAAQAMMDSRSEGFEDVPDEYAAYTLEYEGGVYATYTASQNAHAQTRLEIVGTEGEIDIEPAFHLDTDVRVERGGTEVEVTSEAVDQMEEEFDYFADRVLAGDPVHADGRHGLVDMRTIAAVHEAAETGGTVRIE